MIKHYGVTLAAIAWAILAAGCADSGISSPTSASSLSDSSASSGGAASGGNAVSASQNSNTQQQNSNGEHRELHGVVSGLSGSCPNLSFTVDGTLDTTNGWTNVEDETR